MGSNSSSGTKTIIQRRKVLTGDQRPSYQSGTGKATKTTTKSVVKKKTVLTGDQRPSYQKGNTTATAKKVSSNASTPKKTSTATAKKTSGTTSKKTSSNTTKKASSNSSSPKKATTKKASSNSSSPKKATTKKASSNSSSPKKATTKKASSNSSSPKTASKKTNSSSSTSKKTSKKTSGGSGSSKSTGNKAGSKTVLSGAVAGLSGSSVASTLKPKIYTNTTADNLTAKQLRAWKNTVDTAITKNLVTSLKKAYEDAVHLRAVTKSGQDENNLSYRFNDLTKVTNQAAQQLTTFMKNFDTSLTAYIGTVEKAEKTASDNMKKSIDQFAEAASKISKLKI